MRPPAHPCGAARRAGAAAGSAAVGAAAPSSAAAARCAARRSATARASGDFPTAAQRSRSSRTSSGAGPAHKVGGREVGRQGAAEGSAARCSRGAARTCRPGRITARAALAAVAAVAAPPGSSCPVRSSRRRVLRTWQPARASLSTAPPPRPPVPSGPRHLVVFVCSPQRRELRVQARHFLPPTQARLAAPRPAAAPARRPRRPPLPPRPATPAPPPRARSSQASSISSRPAHRPHARHHLRVRSRHPPASRRAVEARAKGAGTEGRRSRTARLGNGPLARGTGAGVQSAYTVSSRPGAPLGGSACTRAGEARGGLAAAA